MTLTKEELDGAMKGTNPRPPSPAIIFENDTDDGEDVVSTPTYTGLRLASFARRRDPPTADTNGN